MRKEALDGFACLTSMFITLGFAGVGIHYVVFTLTGSFFSSLAAAGTAAFFLFLLHAYLFLRIMENP